MAPRKFVPASRTAKAATVTIGVGFTKVVSLRDGARPTGFRRSSLACGPEEPLELILITGH